ncbi:MAG: site-2 protease family protein [Patescibacteria group bacterium]
MTVIFSIAILVISIVVHEVSHGIAALWQGDPTSKYAGRLTLNPLKHIDPIGSVLIPVICALLPGGIMFGWAKPVPINPYNFRNPRLGEAIVSFAGPLSNITIALIFGLILRFYIGVLPEATTAILAITVITNLVLAIFNLVPVPPLDGSKILLSILPDSMANIKAVFDQYGMFLAIFFIFFLWQYFTPLIYIAFGAITGLSF